LDGEAESDWSGRAVALSADGGLVAIGAAKNDGIGHARVYSWDGTTWVQLGSDIDGEAAGDDSGWAVSLNDAGTILAVGAKFNDDNGNAAGKSAVAVSHAPPHPFQPPSRFQGHVRVFSWDGSSWVQLGADIDGEAGGSKSGQSVSLSAGGTVIAIGAWKNNGGGVKAGQVRVYSMQQLCAENQYVSSTVCTACPAGTTNAANDDASGADTTCDATLCGANQYVSSTVCTACPAGTTNAANDDASGPDTACDATFCAADEYVSSNACVPCDAGTTNAETIVCAANAGCSSLDLGGDCCPTLEGTLLGCCTNGEHGGDDASGADTVCAATLCSADEYVSSNACAPCAPGTTNAQDDDASDADTACDVTLCGADEHVSTHACVPCDAGTTNPQGDPASGADTVCVVLFCSADEYVSSNTCAPCNAGTTNAETDDASGVDTTCDVTFCSVDEHVSSHVCTPCPAGTTNADGGDDASGANTDTCVATVCGVDEYVSSNVCTPCDGGSTADGGGDASGADTTCSVPTAAPTVAPGSGDTPVPTGAPSPVPTFQAILDRFDETVVAYTASATTVSAVAGTTAVATASTMAAVEVFSASASGGAAAANGGASSLPTNGDPLVMASQMQFVCASAMLQAGMPDSYRDVAASFRWSSLQYGIPGLSLDGRKTTNSSSWTIARTTNVTTPGDAERRLSFFGGNSTDEEEEEEEEEEEDAVSGYLRALGLSAEEVFLGNFAWVGLVGGCVYALHLQLLKMLVAHMSKRGHPDYEPPISLQPPGLEMTMSLVLFPGLVQAASVCLFASGAFIAVRIFAGMVLAALASGVCFLAYYLWRGCDPKSPNAQVRFEPAAGGEEKKGDAADDALEKDGGAAAEKGKRKETVGVKISYLIILVHWITELFNILVDLLRDAGAGEWKPVEETNGAFQRIYAVVFEKFKGSAYGHVIVDLVRKILEAVVYAALAGGASWHGPAQTAVLTCIGLAQAVYILWVEPYSSRFINLQSAVRDGAQFCVLAYAFVANLGLVPPETVATVVMLLNFLALGVLVVCQLLGLAAPLFHLIEAATKVAAVLPTMKFDSRALLNSIAEARKIIARVMSASAELDSLIKAALEGAVESYQEAYEEAVGEWKNLGGDNRSAANKLALGAWHSAGLGAAAAFLTSRESEEADEDAETELEAPVRLWKKLGDSVLGSGGDDAPSPREFFETFDSDSNGFLSEYAFALTLVTMGIHLAMDEQAHLLKHMNRDGDGNVSFEEFARLFQFSVSAHVAAEEQVAKAKERAVEAKRAAANHTAVAVGAEGGAAAKYAAPVGDDGHQLAALDEDQPAADDAAPGGAEDGKPATLHSTGSVIKADMALITTTTFVGAFDEDINDDASLVEAIKAAVIDRLAGYVSSTLHPDVDRGVENAPLAIQLIPGFTGMCKVSLSRVAPSRFAPLRVSRFAPLRPVSPGPHLTPLPPPSRFSTWRSSWRSTSCSMPRSSWRPGSPSRAPRRAPPQRSSRPQARKRISRPWPQRSRCA